MNMSLSELSTDELQECTKQLEEVLESHVQWLSRINQTLICHLEPAPSDMAEDAYCNCKFGRWYHGEHHKDCNGGVDIGIF